MDLTSEKKLDLTEVGTRYDHYMELKEVFMAGVDIIDNMSNAHKTDGDKALRVKLSNAVAVIDHRLCYLADFNAKTAFWEKLPKEIREIENKRRFEANRQKLLEAENKYNASQEKDASQGSTPQDTEGSTQNPA